MIVGRETPGVPASYTVIGGSEGVVGVGLDEQPMQPATTHRTKQAGKRIDLTRTKSMGFRVPPFNHGLNVLSRPWPNSRHSPRILRRLKANAFAFYFLAYRRSTPSRTAGAVVRREASRLRGVDAAQ